MNLFVGIFQNLPLRVILETWVPCMEGISFVTAVNMQSLPFYHANSVISEF